jgi:hypothetical protein
MDKSRMVERARLKQRNDMRSLGAIAYLSLLLAFSPSGATEIRINDVASLAGVRDIAPSTVVFTDQHDDQLADPATGLTRFDDWSQAMPLHKRFLSPYPDYQQRMISVGPDKAKHSLPERLHMYVAEARFAVSKPPQAIDLSRYASIGFLERLDPAIRHRAIPPSEADSATDPHPGRRWCEPETKVVCIQSRYQLEGKLPMGVQLVNQLSNRKTIADYVEFQSELRVLGREDLDQLGLTALTAVDGPVAGALEQTIFHVNQLMRFGKFLALLQQDPQDRNRTVATVFVALALKTRLLESQQRYQNVPVLRNLVPAQVLMGRSSFNAGNSISAGLPVYVRNNIKAIASILEEP